VRGGESIGIGFLPVIGAGLPAQPRPLIVAVLPAGAIRSRSSLKAVVSPDAVGLPEGQT
jgi:hypothetical protein